MNYLKKEYSNLIGYNIKTYKEIFFISTILLVSLPAIIILLPIGYIYSKIF